MTMASLRKAAVCIIFAFFLSSGAVISAFLDFGEKYGYSIMRLTVPLTVIMLMAALINYRVLIPRFLLRGNYASYGICAFMLAYAVPLAGIGFERVVREQLGLPHRIMDYSSPWILADALSSCVLIIALLAGMSIIVLYRRWKEQTYEAISLEKRLNDNIAMMKSRLNPGYITASLTRITDLFHTDAEKANTEIRLLSDFLRHQLYELPMPDSTAVYPATETEGKRQIVAEIISEPRYRVWRHLLLQIMIAMISIGSFFDTPDMPQFSLRRCYGVLSLDLVLNIIAYTNIYVLFPYFLRRGHERRYAAAVGIFMTFLAVAIIAIQVKTYDPAPYGRNLPLPILCISTIGSLLTLVLYLGATAALLSLKKWLAGNRRIAELNAETSRCELSFLKKQINPHFLFNVLNNAGVMAYDEPDTARNMLEELRRLLDYQLAGVRNTSTTIGAERQFVEAYLALEKTRRDNFIYSVVCSEGAEYRCVPPLLFIPFVENAVKYSPRDILGTGGIEICFTLQDNQLVFTCSNPIGSDARPSGGGLGIANTRRRLQLIYRDRFSLSTDDDGHTFLVTLKIPVWTA